MSEAVDNNENVSGEVDYDDNDPPFREEETTLPVEPEDKWKLTSEDASLAWNDDTSGIPIPKRDQPDDFKDSSNHPWDSKKNEYSVNNRDYDRARTDNKFNGQKSNDEEHNCSLFVSRFNRSTVVKDIEDLMQQFGPLVEVVLRDNNAFVEFVNISDAVKAKEACHYHPGLGSDSLIVDFKKDKGATNKSFRPLTRGGRGFDSRGGRPNTSGSYQPVPRPRSRSRDRAPPLNFNGNNRRDSRDLDRDRQGYYPPPVNHYDSRDDSRRYPVAPREYPRDPARDVPPRLSTRDVPPRDMHHRDLNGPRDLPRVAAYDDAPRGRGYSSYDEPPYVRDPIARGPPRDIPRYESRVPPTRAFDDRDSYSRDNHNASAPFRRDREDIRDPRSAPLQTSRAGSYDDYRTPSSGHGHGGSLARPSGYSDGPSAGPDRHWAPSNTSSAPRYGSLMPPNDYYDDRYPKKAKFQ